MPDKSIVESLPAWIGAVILAVTSAVALLRSWMIAPLQVTITNLAKDVGELKKDVKDLRKENSETKIMVARNEQKWEDHDKMKMRP